MRNPTFLLVKLIAIVAPVLWPALALGQEDTGAQETGGEAPAPTPVMVAPPTVTTQTTITPFGLPGGDATLDEGLPSSSREAGQSSFDLGYGSTGTVRGSSSGSYVLGEQKAAGVPAQIVVRRGDTLWDLCGHYYDNPYAWPRVWSYNPQIENPNWIYPGDRLRLRPGGGIASPQTLSGTGTFSSRTSMVPPGTVFLRDHGYVGDWGQDVWGQIVGSPDDQMLLSENDEAYVHLPGDREIRIGQELTIFSPERKPEQGKTKGVIVAIKGTVRVNAWDSETRVARVDIIESINAIERGDKVGPVGRRFDVVPPVPNDQEVAATIAASFEPRELVGQHQLVFLDKGEEDGLRPGNRLFVIRKGDRWRQSLTDGTDMAANRVRYELHDVEIEEATDVSRGREFPREVVGELRVLRTEPHTAAALVTFAAFELEPGDQAVARRGY